MADIDDVMKGVFNRELFEERKEKSLADYEARVVKKMMIKLGLEAQMREIAITAKEKTGHAVITFDGFFEMYSTFPMWLQSRRIPFAYQVKPKDIFNKFCSTPMYEEWSVLKDENPQPDKPTGLVFDWPGITSTQCIIHNCQSSLFNETNHVKITRAVGIGKHKQSVIIEQFEPFLEYLCSTWTPH